MCASLKIQVVVLQKKSRLHRELMNCTFIIYTLTVMLYVDMDVVYQVQ